MSTFTDYVSDIYAKYDGRDMFLGYLVWYTVTEDTEVEHSVFTAQLLTQLNDVLDEDVELPPAPRPSDVFKRACKASERKRQLPVDDTHSATNYMIREAGADPDHVWKVIVRERVDTEGHSLGYDELYRVTFVRKPGVIKFENINGQHDLTADTICDNIDVYYHANLNKLTAYAVREYVRKLLERQLHAIKVRSSGGVYFVSKDKSPVVEAIDSIVNGLDSSANFHIMPLVDDSKQREMLKAAFEDESIGEIDSLLGDITDILKSDKRITADRYAGFQASFTELRKKIVSYSDLLDEAMEATASRLEIAQTQMFELLAKVK